MDFRVLLDLVEQEALEDQEVPVDQVEMLALEVQVVLEEPAAEAEAVDPADIAMVKEQLMK